MEKPLTTQITEVLEYGPSKDGHRVGLVFRVVSGNRAMVEMPLEVAEKLRLGVTEAIGKAHDIRVATDPTYQKPGEVQLGTAKRVVAFGTGVDLKNHAVVLSAHHHDGTVSHLPIPESQIADVIEGLQRGLERIQSGEKPQPHSDHPQVTILRAAR